MNLAGFIGAGLGLVALAVALLRIIGLTNERGELRLQIGSLKTDLKSAEQARADAEDRALRLTSVAENRQKVISELLQTLRKVGGKGAAGMALDELLSPAKDPPDPKTP